MNDIITEIIRAPLDSSLILGLSVMYALVVSVRTYHARLIKAKRRGSFVGVASGAEGRGLPTWINAMHWTGWLLFGALLVLHWKYALALYAFLFLLRALPVLEGIGFIIMRPFLK